MKSKRYVSGDDPLAKAATLVQRLCKLEDSYSRIVKLLRENRNLRRKSRAKLRPI